MLELISDFIGPLINVLSSILFAKIILREKIQIKRSYLFFVVIIFAICLQLMCYLNITIIKTLMCYLVILILFKFLYSLDIIKSILLSFCYFIIQILSDMLSIVILTFVFGKEYFFENIAGSFFGNVAVFVVILILTCIFKKILKKIINVKIRHRLIFMLIVTIICIIAVFYSTYQLGTNSIDNLLGFFCLIVIISILSYSFIQIYKNNQLTEEYDKLLEFIKKYEIEIDNQRILRHETKNQLLTIKSKIIDKDKNEAIINYINEIIKEDKKVKHSEYAKFKSLPSNGIKGLFYFKVSLA